MNSLYYQEFGQNKDKTQTVILLHGLFGQSDNLSTLAKELANDFYIIVPDLINHGRSLHRSSMSYPLMAADIIQLMDELGITCANVVGHSMGGKVAMQMAVSYQKRVSGLVVADIAPAKYPATHNGVFRVMEKVKNEKIERRSQADAILSEEVPELGLRQFFLKSLKRSEDGLWEWCYGLDEISKAYPSICDAPDLHASYNQPCLFIKGSESDYINDGHKSLIQRFFPEANLKIIQNAGHWLHVEKPLAFNRLVRGFLENKQIVI